MKKILMQWHHHRQKHRVLAVLPTHALVRKASAGLHMVARAVAANAGHRIPVRARVLADKGNVEHRMDVPVVAVNVVPPMNVLGKALAGKENVAPHTDVLVVAANAALRMNALGVAANAAHHMNAPVAAENVEPLIVVEGPNECCSFSSVPH